MVLPVDLEVGVGGKDGRISITGLYERVLAHVCLLCVGNEVSKYLGNVFERGVHGFEFGFFVAPPTKSIGCHEIILGLCLASFANN